MTRSSSTPDLLEYGPDDPLLRRYLLRDLGHGDVQEVERRIFFEDLFFKRADIVESELIEEYVRGALSESDRRKFERNYLCTAERRRQVQLTRSLAELRPRRTAPAVMAPSASRPRSGPASRSTGAWAWGAVAAAAVMVFALGVSRSSLWPSRAWPSKAPRNYLGAGAPQPPVPSTVDRDLDADAPGARGLPTLILPPPASSMRVRLRSAGEITGNRYPAALETAAGALIWIGEASRIPSGELAITVPVGSTQPGRYRIRLETAAEIGHDTVIEFEAVQ